MPETELTDVKSPSLLAKVVQPSAAAPPVNSLPAVLLTVCDYPAPEKLDLKSTLAEIHQLIAQVVPKNKQAKANDSKEQLFAGHSVLTDITVIDGIKTISTNDLEKYLGSMQSSVENTIRQINGFNEQLVAEGYPKPSTFLQISFNVYQKPPSQVILIVVVTIPDCCSLRLQIDIKQRQNTVTSDIALLQFKLISQQFVKQLWANWRIEKYTLAELSHYELMALLLTEYMALQTIKRFAILQFRHEASLNSVTGDFDRVCNNFLAHLMNDAKSAPYDSTHLILFFNQYIANIAGNYFKTYVSKLKHDLFEADRTYTLPAWNKYFQNLFNEIGPVVFNLLKIKFIQQDMMVLDFHLPLVKLFSPIFTSFLEQIGEFITKGVLSFRLLTLYHTINKTVVAINNTEGLLQKQEYTSLADKTFQAIFPFIDARIVVDIEQCINLPKMWQQICKLCKTIPNWQASAAFVDAVAAGASPSVDAMLWRWVIVLLNKLHLTSDKLKKLIPTEPDFQANLITSLEPFKAAINELKISFEEKTQDSQKAIVMQCCLDQYSDDYLLLARLNFLHFLVLTNRVDEVALEDTDILPILLLIKNDKYKVTGKELKKKFQSDHLQLSEKFWPITLWERFSGKTPATPEPRSASVQSKTPGAKTRTLLSDSPLVAATKPIVLQGVGGFKDRMLTRRASLAGKTKDSKKPDNTSAAATATSPPPKPTGPV